MGKTEIARRLAKMVNAPFVKVEATKFTEVGFHGRDVDQIIRDLVDLAILQTKNNLQKENKEKIERAVEDRLLNLLIGANEGNSSKESFRDLLQKGMLDNRMVTVEVPRNKQQVPLKGPGTGIQVDVRDLFQALGNEKTRRSMTVGEARQVLSEEEVDRMFDSNLIIKKAMKLVEENGIVFIDEVDKVFVVSSKNNTKQERKNINFLMLYTILYYIIYFHKIYIYFHNFLPLSSSLLFLLLDLIFILLLCRLSFLLINLMEQMGRVKVFSVISYQLLKVVLFTQNMEILTLEKSFL